MMFRTIDKEVIKKQLPDMLEQLEVVGLDSLLACPVPYKLNDCGVIHINNHKKYCNNPRKIEECRLLYGDQDGI